VKGGTGEAVALADIDYRIQRTRIIDDSRLRLSDYGSGRLELELLALAYIDTDYNELTT